MARVTTGVKRVFQDDNGASSDDEGGNDRPKQKHISLVDVFRMPTPAPSRHRPRVVTQKLHHHPSSSSSVDALSWVVPTQAPTLATVVVGVLPTITVSFPAPLDGGYKPWSRRPSSLMIAVDGVRVWEIPFKLFNAGELRTAPRYHRQRYKYTQLPTAIVKLRPRILTSDPLCILGGVSSRAVSIEPFTVDQQPGTVSIVGVNINSVTEKKLKLVPPLTKIQCFRRGAGGKILAMRYSSTDEPTQYRLAVNLPLSKLPQSLAPPVITISAWKCENGRSGCRNDFIVAIPMTIHGCNGVVHGGASHMPIYEQREENDGVIDDEIETKPETKKKKEKEKKEENKEEKRQEYTDGGDDDDEGEDEERGTMVALDEYIRNGFAIGYETDAVFVDPFGCGDDVISP